jgi:single-strand DNA-binding protein
LKKEIEHMQRNRLEVGGYLAAKPALRYLPSGTPIANVRLGESYRYQDPDGKPQQHTNWHNLSFYGDLTRVAMTFDKGDNIFVEGTIEQRQFTPKGDGVQRIVHEVVVRNCHIIAPPRGTTAKGATTAASGEAAVPDLQEGATDHDGWPVG